MGDGAQGFRQQLRDIASTWLLAIVVLVVALVVTYPFVGPAPPKQIVAVGLFKPGSTLRYD